MKTIKDAFVFRTLDISTNHVTREDALKLDACDDGTICAYNLGEYGWLVYVGEIEDNWPADEWSAAFRNIMLTARDMDCDYVRFDRDGREYEELPLFDW